MKMEKETIKASALTGAGVFTVMFLLMLFNQAGDTQIGYCNSTNEICIAVDGFSGGSSTRCYNETDMNWWEAPYCKEGWTIVTNDLPTPNITEPEKPIPTKTQGVWGNQYTCDSNGCVLKK